MLEIKRLACPQCGRELSGSDHYITRLCQTCLRHWMITEDGLSEVDVYRAVEEGEADLMLPFWIVHIDSKKLAEDLRAAAEEFMQLKGVLSGVRLKGKEEKLPVSSFSGPWAGMEKMEMTGGVRSDRRMAGRREIEHFIDTMADSRAYRVYIPAFISTNPFSYLKAGRLLTSRQPSFRVERSAGLRNPVLCSVDSSEALALADFVFLSSLPKSILRCGRMLEDISLHPSSPAALVNFPFIRGRGSLISLIGGFSISSGLLQPAEPAGRK